MEVPASVWASLGAFAPCAVLGWWVINQLTKQLDKERDRNNALADRLVSVVQAQTTVLAEIKAMVKGGV